MSQILAYSLNQAAIRSTPLVHDYKTFLEQIEFLTPKDVLIALSFPPYSKETIDAVKFASKKKVPIIAITDKLTSPVTFYSQKIIPVRSQNMNFTNSFSAISVIINAIATELSIANEKMALKNLKEINSKLIETGHYNEE
jgi:DNA-binding MurR/RpiR family transcriptional regulator